MASSNIDNHIPKSRHRGWSPHSSSERYRQAQPKRKVVGIYVTSGGIGTHGMHPPREPLPVSSETGIDTKSNRYVFLCGRAQRPSPTRWICFKKRQFRSQERNSQVKNGRDTHKRNKRSKVSARGRNPPKPNGRFAMPAEMGTLNLRTPYRQMSSVLRNAVGEFT
jgi:hypothetical protein